MIGGDKKTAGKFVGAGGYGCVFDPALKCDKGEKNDLSKLMMFSEGLAEYEKNMEIKSILSKIKDLDEHFLFCSSWCRPKKMSEIQSKRVRKRCDNEVGEEFEKMGVNNLILLMMKSGGEDLDKKIEKIGKMSKKKREVLIKDLNNRIIKMVEKACIPMNNLDVYHSDMKALNMVCKDQNVIKIIDWGLAEIGNPIGYESHYSGIHFNKPYESLLFNIEDGESGKEMVKKIGLTVDDKKDKILRSHMKSDILLLFRGCVEIENEDEEVMKILKEYLEKMGYLCMRGGLFSRRKLITSYYKKQDLWGVMTCYLDICKYGKVETIMRSDILHACRYLVDDLEISGNKFVEKLKSI